MVVAGERTKRLLNKRTLLVVNGGLRMGYGAVGLLSPSLTERLRLGPNTAGQSEARLFVRAFSAHQIGVGALAIASLLDHRLRQPAAIAAVAIDAFDLAAVVAEGRGRVEPVSRDLIGGAVLSALGMLTAASVVQGERE